MSGVAVVRVNRIRRSRSLDLDFKRIISRVFKLVLTRRCSKRISTRVSPAFLAPLFNVEVSEEEVAVEV